MTELGPVVNLQTSQGMPWRETSKLHKIMKARFFHIPLVMTANQPLTLFQGQFTAATIDRIVGFYLSLGILNKPGTFTLTEINTGWTFGITAAATLGNYWANLVTPENTANLVLTSSINVAKSDGATIELYNVEIQPAVMGHS